MVGELNFGALCKGFYSNLEYDRIDNSLIDELDVLLFFAEEYRMQTRTRMSNSELTVNGYRKTGFYLAEYVNNHKRYPKNWKELEEST